MFTTINTSISVNLEFTNRDELSDFYGMLASAYSALCDKVEDINPDGICAPHRDYLINRKRQFLDFVSKFNPNTVLGCNVD